MTKKTGSSHATSEVLATVLLLGITIILFGFLNYIVFSFSFEPTAPSVNLIGSLSEDEIYNNITIEHNGGESLEGNTRIVITVGTHISTSSVQEIINGITDWRLTTSQNDKHPDTWDFGETVQFTSPFDFTNTYIQASVLDPATNSLILSVVLQQGPTTTVLSNKPPTITSPSPTNSSTGNPLDLTWSIQINDQEGDPFTWTIQCSNGQTNAGAGPNGQKTLTLTGLSHLTTYKIWVNATDPAGSNQYIRKWYVFTTSGNLPPVFGAPLPANGSIDQSLGLTWSIPVNDLEGNTFTWTIQPGPSNAATDKTTGQREPPMAPKHSRSQDLSMQPPTRFGSMPPTRQAATNTPGNGTPSPPRQTFHPSLERPPQQMGPPEHLHLDHPMQQRTKQRGNRGNQRHQNTHSVWTPK